MRKYLLSFLILSLLILSWCWESNEIQVWTWDSTSWAFDSLIQDYSEVTSEPSIPVENTEENNGTEIPQSTSINENSEDTSSQALETNSWEAVWNGSWTITPPPVRNTWFWVDECDRIIDFNLCVISKAPFENQEPMKESLKKAVEPWKLLATTQLREVCQKTIEKDTFKEVREHYEALDDWCKY